MAAIFADLKAFAADFPSLAAWLMTLATALAAVLAALVGRRLAWAAASRLTHSHRFANSLLGSARGPTRAVFALIALQLVWEAAPDDLPRLATVERLTTLALIAALVWLGIRASRRSRTQSSS